MSVNLQNQEFSLLMSVYKGANPFFLEDAVESSFEQIVIPTELILVEDGPLTSELDDTINKMCEKYKTIERISLEKNVGLGLALQEGLKHTNCELVARADADDLSKTSRFKKELDAFKNNKDLIIVGSQIDEFKDDPRKIIGKREVPTSDNEIRQFAKYRSPFNHPTVMFKKSAILNAGSYQPFEKLEDYDLWMRVLSQPGIVANIDEALVLMRVGDGMYSRRGGWKYLKQYYRLRNEFYRRGSISMITALWGDVLMTANTMVPTFIRQYLYQNILHKG